MINVAFVSRPSRDQFSARRMNKREKFIAIFNRCRKRHVVDPRLAAQSQLLPQGDDDEMTVSATRRARRRAASGFTIRGVRLGGGDFSAEIITRPYCEFLIDDAISSHDENYIIIIIVAVIVIIVIYVGLSVTAHVVFNYSIIAKSIFIPSPPVPRSPRFTSPIP